MEGALTYTPTHCDCCHVENKDYTIIKNGTKKLTIVILNIADKRAGRWPVSCFNILVTSFQSVSFTYRDFAINNDVI
nr:hypothetical protein [Halolactibacillus miurensis]